MYAVLFVCLGNICRSPLAEAAFRRAAGEAKLSVKIDSAGTGDWHVGHPPDHRARAVALKNGVDIGHYRGRQVSPEDFRAFTHIIAMDHSNLVNLEELRPADATASLSMLLDHVPGRAGHSVADPYYGHEEDFDRTWSEVVAGAEGLLRTLRG